MNDSTTWHLSLDELEAEHDEGKRMITLGKLRINLVEGTLLRVGTDAAHVHINSLVDAARKSGIIVPMGFGVEEEVDDHDLFEVSYFYFYSQEFDKFYRTSLDEGVWVDWGEFVLAGFEEVELDDANSALGHERAVRYDMIQPAAIAPSPVPLQQTSLIDGMFNLPQDRLF